MAISTRFSVGIHILSLIATDEKMTSDLIAGSVNTNPVVIRKIMSMLKKADLIEVRPVSPVRDSPARCLLLRYLTFITPLLSFRTRNCSVSMPHRTQLPVGRNIQSTVTPIFELRTIRS